MLNIYQEFLKQIYIFFIRKNDADATVPRACKHSERGRPNNNSAVLVGRALFVAPAVAAALINIPPWAPSPPVLIRSWNLWRTHT